MRRLKATRAGRNGGSPAERPGLARAVSILLCFVLTAVFCLAAYEKSQEFTHFRLSLINSSVVPVGLVTFVAATTIAVEFLISTSLWVPRLYTAGLKTATALCCIFIGYSAWRWINAIPVPCSCFGTLLKMTPGQSIALDLALIALLFYLRRAAVARYRFRG